MNAVAGRRSITLITGASEGIGWECAHVFSAHGHDLALVARRAEKLEALADSIAAAGRPRPLVFAHDLALRDAPDRLAEDLANAGAAVSTLVNNAGYGLLGRVDSLSAQDQLAMIDLNVRALTALTLRFLPEIKAHQGGILNVASIAGFAPGPGMAVYYATKAYVLSFSEALSEELRAEGVRVSALCPGPVYTGFQARAGMGHIMPSTKTPGVLSARATAEAGFSGLQAGKRVILPGIGVRALAYGLAWIPHVLLLPKIFARQSARKK